MKLFKITIYLESSRHETHRYGEIEEEVIKRLREEYRRYNDKRATGDMTAEEVCENNIN